MDVIGNVFTRILLQWGHKEADVRGPVIGTNRHNRYRNAIGAHGGSYCVYRGLAVRSVLDEIAVFHICLR